MHSFTHYCCVFFFPSVVKKKKKKWGWLASCGTRRAPWRKPIVSPDPRYPSFRPVDHWEREGSASQPGTQTRTPSPPSAQGRRAPATREDPPPPPPDKPQRSRAGHGPRLQRHQQLPLAWIHVTSVSKKSTQASIWVSFSWVARTISYKTWL